MHRRSTGIRSPATDVRSGRGRFLNDAEALKCLYLVTWSLGPAGQEPARWITRWSPANNAFAITFEGPIN